MFYVRVRDVDGMSDLFEHEDRAKCEAFMEKWAGPHATKVGSTLVTMFGTTVWISTMSRAKLEALEVLECMKYEEAIEHYCTAKDCKNCAMSDDDEECQLRSPHIRWVTYNTD